MVLWAFLICLASMLLAVANLAVSPRKGSIDFPDTPMSPDDVGGEIVSDEEIEAFLQRMRSLEFTRVDTVRLPLSTDAPKPDMPSTVAQEWMRPESRDNSRKAVDTSAADVMTVLVIGVAAAGLLLILLFVVVMVVVCRRNKEKIDMSLNKDLNRWDPQLLRPSKKDIDAFIFGTPIPTVTEMIKQ